MGVLWRYCGVLERYCWGTVGYCWVLEGYCKGTEGILHSGAQTDLHVDAHAAPQQHVEHGGALGKPVVPAGVLKGVI